MKIRIADVIIPKRLRQADTQKVREIADSIERLELLNPITSTATFFNIYPKLKSFQDYTTLKGCYAV